MKVSGFNSIGRVITLVLMAALAPGRVAATPVAVVGGYDHYAGALGQRTDGVLAAMVVAGSSGDVLVVGSRFDDTVIGKGYGLTGGAGVSIDPAIHLRASATRFLGDGEFRAWRTKVGPEFVLPREWKLGVSYSHYVDNADATSNGVIAEASAPLSTAVTGKLSASSASTPSGPRALQGSVGASWSLAPHLALSGDVGLARNAAGAAGQPFPGHGGLIDGLPIIGGGGPSDPGSIEQQKKVDATLLLGIRVTLP